MRAGWCGFALGVMWLQQQAALPDWKGWCGLMALGGMAIALAVWGLRRDAGVVARGRAASGADAAGAADAAAASEPADATHARDSADLADAARAMAAATVTRLAKAKDERAA